MIIARAVGVSDTIGQTGALAGHLRQRRHARRRHHRSALRRRSAATPTGLLLRQRLHRAAVGRAANCGGCGTACGAGGDSCSGAHLPLRRRLGLRRRAEPAAAASAASILQSDLQLRRLRPRLQPRRDLRSGGACRCGTGAACSAGNAVCCADGTCSDDRHLPVRSGATAPAPNVCCDGAGSCVDVTPTTPTAAAAASPAPSPLSCPDGACTCHGDSLRQRRHLLRQRLRQHRQRSQQLRRLRQAACATGEVCSGGTCLCGSTACAGDQLCCGGSCVTPERHATAARATTSCKMGEQCTRRRLLRATAATTASATEICCPSTARRPAASGCFDPVERSAALRRLQHGLPAGRRPASPASACPRRAIRRAPTATPASAAVPLQRRGRAAAGTQTCCATAASI